MNDLSKNPSSQSLGTANPSRISQDGPYSYVFRHTPQTRSLIPSGIENIHQTTPSKF